MAIDIAQFYQTFFEESFEGLDVMESGLLHLHEESTESDLIHTIFRAAHSIKGGSATFGFNQVASLTHVMETLLDEMRDGRRSVTQDAVDVLLQAVDCLREMLAATRDGQTIDAERSEVVQRSLEHVLHSQAEESFAPPSFQTTSGSSPQTSPAALPMAGWRIHFRPHAQMLQSGNDVVRILRELSVLGTRAVQVDISQLPAFADLEPETSYLAWEIALQSDASLQQIQEVFAWVEDECDLQITPMVEPAANTPEPQPRQAAAPAPAAAPAKVTPLAPPDAPPSPPKESWSGEDRRASMERRSGEDRRVGGDRRTSSAAAETSSIRVSIDKVDALINMVGELVITQSMLGQLGEDFDMSRLEKLRDGLAQLERNTRELQENVMRIRMLPISFAFNRFPRMVHDLSQKLNKKINLTMSGEQTELDKTVMEKIGDPLVHLVRNSLDHGIEAPEVRIAAGKPEVGSVHLNAYHQGGNILIEISDDGAGINREKVRQKAIARGLIGTEEALPEEKVLDLIFQPGFSTAEVVSDVSGRGVGMDVVRRNIKDLGGSIEVSSHEGKGSTFTIRLPLTLAILDGQLVRVGSQIYIIPLVSIVESLQIQPELISAVAGQAELYKLRDAYIPTIGLADLFSIDSSEDESSEGLLVVVEGDGRRAALVVDDLLGQQQVVIKSLETNYKRVEGVSGATILGDGRVALILDIAGLIRLAQHSGGHTNLRQRARTLSVAA